MRRLALLGSALLLAACSGGSAGSTATQDAGATFPAAALTSAKTDSGALTIELRSDPQPPVRGKNVFQVLITDGAGQPVNALSLAVEPWMPAMGHGSSVTPTVKSTGVGVFEVDDVYLAMPGDWQVRLEISGAQTDHATLDVQIP